MAPANQHVRPVEEPAIFDIQSQRIIGKRNHFLVGFEAKKNIEDRVDLDTFFLKKGRLHRTFKKKKRFHKVTAVGFGRRYFHLAADLDRRGIVRKVATRFPLRLLGFRGQREKKVAPSRHRPVAGLDPNNPPAESGIETGDDRFSVDFFFLPSRRVDSGRKKSPAAGASADDQFRRR